MSMTACKECNNSISTKAEVCPHCGFRRCNSPGVGIFGALLGMGIGALMLYAAWVLVAHLLTSSPP